MVRALIRGDREASPIVALGLLALIAALVAAFGLVFAYRGQLVDLKHVIYGRCTQRQHYDQANHLSVGADVTYYRSALAQALDNRPAAEKLIRSFPGVDRVALRRSESQQIATIRRALAAKEHAYRVGVVGNCNAYR